MPMRGLTRRALLQACVSTGMVMATVGRSAPVNSGKQCVGESPVSSLDVILAPSNLGLRPLAEGHEPGTWRAPGVLVNANIVEKTGAKRLIRTPRPAYSFDAQPGTRIRNGRTLREHALMLADAVDSVLDRGHFPVVLGGDCSILLGCLLGARRNGPLALIHVDGHSDFFHPGNYDTSSRLGTAAGMDLALVTGRGEPLLTEWPGIEGPLVEDAFVVQIGARNEEAEDKAVQELVESGIRSIPIRQILDIGIEAAAAMALSPVGADRRKFWLHLDLDVLDQAIMPAVDSPGSPGLDFRQLTQLLDALLSTGRAIGINVSIYDPELDRDRRYATEIVDCLASALAIFRSA